MTEIGEVAERAREFAIELEETKRRLAPSDFWYPYRSIGNFQFLDSFLTGDQRDLSHLAGGKPIADVGGADGECSFLLDRLGYPVHLIENPPTNFNGLRGARMLKEAFASSVDIVEVNLDAQFSLPQTEYGLVFLLGLLYHLKNPFYVMETLSYRARFCLLSTRVARFSPDKVDLGDIPVAYLVDERELNNDPSNYWVFSHAGLKRLLSRSGWAIRSEKYFGNTAESDPRHQEKDERAFLLLESERAVSAAAGSDA